MLGIEPAKISTFHISDANNMIKTELLDAAFLTLVFQTPQSGALRSLIILVDRDRGKDAEKFIKSIRIAVVYPGELIVRSKAGRLLQARIS